MVNRQNGVIWEKEIPIAFTVTRGDFNGDLVVNADDIDILAREVRMHGGWGKPKQRHAVNWYLDWNDDGEMDESDLTLYLSQMGWEMGDVNTSGSTSNADLNIAFASITNPPSGTPTWVHGNVDGDGDVDGEDLVLIGEQIP